MTWALQSLNGGSLEITLTFPLSTIRKLIKFLPCPLMFIFLNGFHQWTLSRLSKIINLYIKAVILM